MTVSLSDITLALWWVWLVGGALWVAYAWLHRIASRRVLFGLVGLGLSNWVVNAVADYADTPDSILPSDFALYSVWMLAAALVGLAAACLYARGRGLTFRAVIQATLVCVLAGGIGGRAYQVWMHWDYYAENRDMIAQVAQGGFGMRGALVLGALALALFAWLTRHSLWKLADAAAVGLAAAQSVGWYGAALTHTHYGLALDAAPPPAGALAPLAQFLLNLGYSLAQDLPDAYNLVALRVPVQLLLSIFFLILFVALLVRARARPAPGEVCAVYLAAASAAGLVIGFWRGDETMLWNGLRIDQWVDAALLLLGLVLWLGVRAGRARARAPIGMGREALQQA